jgi:hypothetical protein
MLRFGHWKSLYLQSSSLCESPNLSRNCWKYKILGHVQESRLKKRVEQCYSHVTVCCCYWCLSDKMTILGNSVLTREVKRKCWFQTASCIFYRHLIVNQCTSTYFLSMSNLSLAFRTLGVYMLPFRWTLFTKTYKVDIVLYNILFSSLSFSVWSVQTSRHGGSWYIAL